MKKSYTLLVSYGVGLAATIITVILVMMAGWISNIVQVVNMAQAENICAMFYVKVVGCFFAPIGSVLGIIGWF